MGEDEVMNCENNESSYSNKVVIVMKNGDSLQKETIDNFKANSLVLIKVGNDHFPANEEMIKNTYESVVGAMKENAEKLTIVTHHAITVEHVYL